MCPHSSYLSSFLKTHYTLLRGDGPLPASQRHLIAILASARFSCSYLIEAHKAQLLQAGGKPEWLERGLATAPAKIMKLYELNKILAHRPWSLTPTHIAQLTRPGQDNWSLSELVYAIVLMVHFHSFSSFIQCCVLMEGQQTKGEEMVHAPAGVHGVEAPYDCSTQRRASISPQLDKVDELLQRMESLRGKQTSLPPKDELTVRFKTVELSSADSETLTVPLEPDISHFVKDMEFQYVDFAKRGRESEFPTFRINVS
jgi:sestrin